MSKQNANIEGDGFVIVRQGQDAAPADGPAEPAPSAIAERIRVVAVPVAEPYPAADVCAATLIGVAFGACLVARLLLD